MIKVIAIWLNVGRAVLDIYCDACQRSLISGASVQAARSLDELTKLAAEHVCENRS